LRGDSGVPSQDVEPPETVLGKFRSNYKDQRAIMGEAALNVIVDELGLEEKFRRLFNDWLVAGEVYTYKGIRGGNMVHERVSPLDIDYDKSPDEEYVEDGQWAVRRMFLTSADVYDMFYEQLSEKEIDLIEDEQGNL